MELMKIPLAVQHFIEHESHKHPGETFFACIYEHYSGENHQDEKGGHCDEEIPFKHCGDCCNHHVVLLPFTLPENHSEIFAITKEDSKFLVEYNEPFVSSLDYSIWQPPKIG